MSFTFRKSKKLGAMRITASKSGLGFSVGGKHFRTGVSANGKSYISGGASGIRYRKELNTNKKGDNVCDKNGDFSQQTPPSLKDYKSWRITGIVFILISIPIFFIPFLGVFVGIILVLLGIVIFHTGSKGVKEWGKTNSTKNKSYGINEIHSNSSEEKTIS
ncbi:MAG: DUF4236 domain-containing protein [Spirochaetaceae bacterium]|nr:DUF4236 domain-containing protein [Spirochaetaceae bacterium]